jgi:hypothetical protein
MRILFIVNIFLCMALRFSGQDSVAFYIEGRVLDKPRKFPIQNAVVAITGRDGFSVNATTNDSGYYSIKFKVMDPSMQLLIEADAKDYYSVGRKFKLNEEAAMHQDFDLDPPINCVDNWFPDYFLFEEHNGQLTLVDSLDYVVQFSMPEFKEMLQNYTYNIVTRRSTNESDRTALARGISIRNLLVQVGIDADRITIENKSTSDFFYCMYCEGCVYAYLAGQGFTVTQDLIDQTSDPIKREEYESLRRKVHVELKRCN